MKTNILTSLLCVVTALNFAQQLPNQRLDSVVVNGNRINIPFKQNSRTINIITKADIKQSAAVNLADILQQIVGVDIRRRGTGGSQADLQIRGGGFDQTLLLIDGIKMDDAQTGHHTMNAALPLEVIERIEIIKGPAARIFGQNAFNGAINIVTKRSLQNTVSANLETGSFGQLNGNITAGVTQQSAEHIVHVGRVTSNGYRLNSDYDNANYFIKSLFNKNKQAIEMVATFMERKFGAQNFYTTNPTFNEYEETQNSLIAFTTTFNTERLKITPRVYWRRNQDMFLLRRNEPAFFRNFHVNNKVGVEANAAYTSKLGVTGFGVDVAKVFLESNNLGNRNRFMATAFLEHQFKLLNDRLDITPGLAATYFSDFDTNVFPGLDVGYAISERFKVYGNMGYTYRIPTYTDLFYSDPATQGNPNLEPEEAFSQEIGIKYFSKQLRASAAVFNRNATNLIDYISPNVSTTIFTATNIREVTTQGMEFDVTYNFKLAKYNQTLAFSYAYLDDDIDTSNNNLSRYQLNTLRHQYNTRLSTKLIPHLSQNIVYKYAERTNGQTYNVWDASLIYTLKQAQFSVTGSNIFNAEYIEAGFVPMPPSNVLFGLRYTFN